MTSKETFHKDLLYHLDLIRKYRRQKGCVKHAEEIKDTIIPRFQEFFRVSINRSPKNPLNFMECLCLGLFARGERQKQVAHWLNLSQTTVNGYETSIRSKLQVSNRQQACSKAHDLNYVVLKPKYTSL